MGDCIPLDSTRSVTRIVAHQQQRQALQMTELLQQHEARVVKNMVKMGVQIDSWHGRLSTMEAQLAHAVAAEGELENSLAARLAVVQTERDTALQHAESVEHARDEAVLALEQSNQDTLAATTTAVHRQMSGFK